MLAIRKRAAGSISDIKVALAPIRGKNNDILASAFLREAKTTPVSSERIRNSRQSLFDIQEAIREISSKADDAMGKCNEAATALQQHFSTPPEQELIETECVDRYIHLIRMQKKLRSLEEQANVVDVQLRDMEATFSQTELLKCLTSKRYAVEPLSIANALAGLPIMGCRQSHYRCSAMPYESESHLSYRLLCSINEIWRKRPTKPLDHPIDFFKEGVLDLEHSSARDCLMKNWHDFKLAVEESWNPGSYFGDELPFVITRTFVSLVSESKAPAQRIIAAKDELRDR